MTWWMPISLQVDYDSEEEEEEEEGGDDGEDKEDQGEEVEQNVENSLEESQPESTGVRVQKKTKRAKRGRGDGEVSLDQMRVNSVLQSNMAIERYCYDLKHELWCEVSLYMLNKLMEKVLRDFSSAFTFRFWMRLKGKGRLYVLCLLFAV